MVGALNKLPVAASGVRLFHFPRAQTRANVVRVQFVAVDLLRRPSNVRKRFFDHGRVHRGTRLLCREISSVSSSETRCQ